ncbi:MAG: hypothetical protein JXB04_04260 [Kiritimatiellae bacterium]|nr:hypothetical protein [Kiritimatiellia bacterium]
MKKLLFCLSLMVLVNMMVGCELTEEDDDDRVKFINLSSTTVQVFPNGQLWPPFALAPGETYTIDTSTQVFFTYEPDWAVEVGENEGGRIYFVDIGAEGVD